MCKLARSLTRFLGFMTQWQDALMFLTSAHNRASGSASEIPVAGGQWKVRRREEHVGRRGAGEFVWEWGQSDQLLLL